jgi:hypothetical protein
MIGAKTRSIQLQTLSRKDVFRAYRLRSCGAPPMCPILETIVKKPNSPDRRAVRTRIGTLSARGVAICPRLLYFVRYLFKGEKQNSFQVRVRQNSVVRRLQKSLTDPSSLEIELEDEQCSKYMCETSHGIAAHACAKQKDKRM